jgi:hypothetical protein
MVTAHLATVHAAKSGDGVLADHDAERRAHLRTAIVRYLQKHPLAGDTPEGIVPCWLSRDGYEDAPLYIEEVLEAMVVAGELAVRRLPDGGVLYVRGPALPG